MPTYEYRCEVCDHEFEVFYTSIKTAAVEEKEERCPECSSLKKQRLVSKDTSFLLKGNGWYKDSYSGSDK